MSIESAFRGAFSSSDLFTEAQEMTELAEINRGLSNWVDVCDDPKEKENRKLVHQYIVDAFLEKENFLYIADFGLSSLPAELGKLINLKTLDLSNNKLTHLPLAIINNLTQLTTFHFSNNPFTSLPTLTTNNSDLAFSFFEEIQRIICAKRPQHIEDSIGSRIFPITWEKIQARNKEKNAHAPIAVYIHSDAPGDPAMNTPTISTEYSLDRLSKTHYIALEGVAQAKDLRTKIRKAINHAPNEGIERKADILFIFAHGGKNVITMGNNSHYMSSDITPTDFQDLKEEASIHLLSCLTGLEFAPQLSRITAKTVYAFENFLYCNRCFFKSNEGYFISQDFNYRSGKLHENKTFIYSPDGQKKCFDGSLEISKEDIAHKLMKRIYRKNALLF